MEISSECWNVSVVKKDLEQKMKRKQLSSDAIIAALSSEGTWGERKEIIKFMVHSNRPDLCLSPEIEKHKLHPFHVLFANCKPNFNLKPS